MAKFFETSEEIQSLIQDEFINNGLATYGLNLKVISTVKGKDIITVSKASPTTEYISKQDSMIIVTVYEKAFDCLDEQGKRIFIEAALSNISYDSEKDKILIDKSQANMIHRMRHKYNNGILDILEQNELIIRHLEELEKEEKERVKSEKEEKKLARQKH